MFDIVRRRKYVERRVLIDSARILDSPFDDSLICLSGAELELLRNVCLYLRRQDTFVASYFAQHYLTPDSTDWDALQAVVAGLEEKLMGCPEVMENIEAMLSLMEHSSALGVPTFYEKRYSYTVLGGWDGNIDLDVVPDNVLRVCDHFAGYDNQRAITSTIIKAYVDGGWRNIEEFRGLSDAVPAGWNVPHVMYPDTLWLMWFQGAQVGDGIRVTVRARDYTLAE